MCAAVSTHLHRLLGLVVLVVVAHHHASAFSSELTGNRLADARGGASHDAHLALEMAHRLLLLHVGCWMCAL